MESDWKAVRKRKEDEEGEPSPGSRGSKEKEEENEGRSAHTARCSKEDEDAGATQQSGGIKGEQEEDNGISTKKSRGRKRKKKEDEGHDKMPSDHKRKEGEGEEQPKKKPRVLERSKEGEEEGPAQGVLQSSGGTRCKQDVVDGISCLPDFAQDTIFQFLSLRDKVRVAQVCSSWRNAVYRPCHWRGLNARVKLSKATASSLKIRKVQGLKLTTSTNVLKKFLQDFDTLESLSLSSENTDILLKSVSNESGERFVLTPLKSLVLHTRNELQMQSLIGILKCFPNLEVLSVAGVATTRLLEAIGEQLKGLKRLRLVNEKRNPRLNLEAVCNLKRLQHLELQNFQLEGIEILSQLSSSLEKLLIRECDLPGGDRAPVHWAPVLSQLGSLNELAVVHCLPALKSPGLRLLAQALPNLQKFTCGNSINRRFEISLQSWLCSDDVCEVAGMSGLQEVHLHWAYSIDSDGMEDLCASLPNLRALTVKTCCALFSRGIEHIAGLSSLAELDLEVAYEGWLKILAEGCCKLRKLALACLKAPEDIMYIAQMSTLCDLSLREVPMGAEGAAHLTTASFHLEALSIVHCGTTIESITPLLQKQTSLKRLILVEQTGTPSTEVPYVKTMLPQLERCSIFHWKLKTFQWKNLHKRLNQ